MNNYRIEIEPFGLVTLLTFSGKQEVNEHGYIEFSGTIPQDMEAEYLYIGRSSTEVTIYAVDMSGEWEIWFKGIIISLEIKSDIEVKTIYVTAKTYSYLMDVSPHTRSYQTPSMTYNTVLASYTTSYPGGDFMMKQGDGTPIKDLILQYRETDWEYTKRLASHFKTVLLPDYKVGGTKYYFGITQSAPVAAIDTGIYNIKKDAVEYDRKKKNGLDVHESDATYHIYRTREMYTLGNCITLNGEPLYISKIETELRGSEVYHTYYMKPLNGFKIRKDHNTQTIGASFHANITDVERDIVKISIQKDENQAGCGSRWFPYSTVYSTPDGTGWYAMPEIGDAVRMYIPNEDEAEAYVISATHLESSDTSERINPDFKSIMNKYKKEVLFKPDALIITNNNGMSIELFDDFGINIISDKAIFIQSEEAFNMISTQSTITVTAEESIIMHQANTKTELMENIAFEGAKIHLD